MSDTKLPEKHSPKTLIGKVLEDLNEVKLPDMIEHNLIRSACRLITGVVDIPVAWLKYIERNISRETEALDLISKSNTQDITQLNSKDLDFIKNTANYYSLKQFKEAANRRKIINLTVNNLRKDIPQIDSKTQIEEEWLQIFSEIAEKISTPELQLIFSKILSSKIKNPTSFHPRTIQTLSLISKSNAIQFQHIFKTFVQHYGSNNFQMIPGQGIGLSKSKLAQQLKIDFDELAEVGLIKHNFRIKEHFKTTPMRAYSFRGKNYKIDKIDLKNRLEINNQLPIITLTRVGSELHSIINLELNREDEKSFLRILKATAGVTLIKM